MEENLSKESKQVTGNVLMNIIGIIIGIVIFVNALNFKVGGLSESKEKYGGDAYTGIQQAAAQTATNVYLLGEAFEEFVNIFGACLGAYIVISNIKEMSKKQ